MDGRELTSPIPHSDWKSPPFSCQCLTADFPALNCTDWQPLQHIPRNSSTHCTDLAGSPRISGILHDRLQPRPDQLQNRLSMHHLFNLDLSVDISSTCKCNSCSSLACMSHTSVGFHTQRMDLTRDRWAGSVGSVMTRRKNLRCGI